MSKVLSRIWNVIKKPFVSIHEWLKGKMPGFKTKLVAGLGALGSLAALLQEYVSGLPLNQLLGVTETLIVSAVLFTLAFWFRGMAK